MAEAVHVFSLGVIALACALGVLHPRYQDNILQRTGMGIACVGASSVVYLGGCNEHSQNAQILFSIGVACFAAGTVWKKIAAQLAR